MSDLLEITGDDISLLSDADLRDLIGLLCEADYRLASMSTSGITWGGHQDASDGGLDVVVRGEAIPPKHSFIPRSSTGFQVKKPDMPRGKILREMKPKGDLRDEIKSLMDVGGAYIIVSSSGSTTDRALKDRCNAMREAISDEENHQKLLVDFFDRGRVASWVRTHPSMILWVRKRIGRPLNGWHPYENWANANGGIEEEYLLDDQLRLYDGTLSQRKELAVEDGLRNIRNALSAPRTAIRLIGLSGVGKTRLAQALFDSRVGENALNPASAYYTDVSYSPNPNPEAFADQLIALRIHSILLVDNCSPELHQRLTKTCSQAYSLVSLITIEYDVRDDLPEETRVFRLEPASEDVIAKLIETRFAHIGRNDRNRIAAFSGGNARVAIALAKTVASGETLSSFRDEDLFKRLFHQRHNPSDSLLHSAQVCSLVYSFEGTDTNSDQSELRLLASLIEVSSLTLYQDVDTLRRRDLIQSRGPWRALLPHAIANRLAKLAFNSIPKDRLVSAFLDGPSERLLRSFTRRLAYLHDCKPAIETAERWLAQDGWIGTDLWNLNSFQMELFSNITPVSPTATLEAIERSCKDIEEPSFCFKDPHCAIVIAVLQHLAYSPELFERSVNILQRFALSKAYRDHMTARSALKSLFYILLSGTHASVETRAEVINDLVGSNDEKEQNLGLVLLDATLKTSYFTSSAGSSFGAWPRNSGYHPKTRDEFTRWYGLFIDICTHVAVSRQSIAEEARAILSNHLPGLWVSGYVFDSLEQSAQKLQKAKAWIEGWVAIRGIIRREEKRLSRESLERLQQLERTLKPNTLFERARTYTLSSPHSTFNLEDDFDDGDSNSNSWERVQKITREIGKEVAKDPDILNSLLPELLSSNAPRAFFFGQGLADGCHNKKQMWNHVRAMLRRVPLEKRQVNTLTGFLSSCSETDPDFYNSTLDQLVTDDSLGSLFPWFQTTSRIDKRGVERLHRYLDCAHADVGTFKCLAWGRAHEPINDGDLAGILAQLLKIPKGVDTAIEILRMRFHRSTNKPPKCSQKLAAVGRNVLLAYPFEDKQTGEAKDHDLARIADVCLKGPRSQRSARQICEHILEALMNHQIYVFDYPGCLGVLAKRQPFSFLDTFLGNVHANDYHRRMLFSDYAEMGKNNSSPLTHISDEDILKWCELQPELRYPLIAETAQIFSISPETSQLKITPLVYTLLDQAPNLEPVLDRLADRINPRAWSGSLAKIQEERSVLFHSLKEHKNADIRDWANNRLAALQKAIEATRKKEQEEKRWLHKQDESFE